MMVHVLFVTLNMGIVYVMLTTIVMTYWDWYTSIFDCEVDHQIDSTWLVAVGCDLLGSGAGCNSSIKISY